MAMDATKIQFLDELENEFGDTPALAGPPRRAGRQRSKLRRRLVASGFAASILGGLLVFNSAPAVAADNCLSPDFVQRTHWKLCSLYASVEHRYSRKVTRTSGGHTETCYKFYSTYHSTCAESTEFPTSACRSA
jgi:hypothetical protein